jgi:hypothetical protein
VRVRAVRRLPTLSIAPPVDNLVKNK